MFSLLSSFYSYLTEKKQLNVLVIGLDGAGKTVSIFKLFLNNELTL